ATSVSGVVAGTARPSASASSVAIPGGAVAGTTTVAVQVPSAAASTAVSVVRTSPTTRTTSMSSAGCERSLGCSRPKTSYLTRSRRSAMNSAPITVIVVPGTAVGADEIEGDT